ncbi:MAG: 50S ribosomal protein L25 [Acidobacteria bacterium]|nr:50S ribosomal protein L25 [Acidobacteriota bacterium]MCG2816770.1 50S ribosomal protein L25 [Candidatus Aminicenantes bacterium]MBU1474468.1 50S ribosomal protein L25 [Acidobacteriota bacterium]MBU2439303.1 50S ribosomal protein L25 [Acidobacteriota bacterium]MBU4203097.1 50S ribosomal protein L25 [Acidobacteriota bacterium]
MDNTVKCEKRDQFGKNAARRLRREHKVPAVLYGANIDSVPLTLEKKDIFSILKSESGENTLFSLQYGSETSNAMIKMLQKDPVSDQLIHVDLIQIVMDEEIKVDVPLELVGTAVGVKSEGGFIDFITREVEIECLPNNIPDSIAVDISALHLNQSLKIEDLPPMEGIRYITDSDQVIVLVQAPTAEKVEVEEEGEEDEAIEGEEGAKASEKEDEKD